MKRMIWSCGSSAFLFIAAYLKTTAANGGGFVFDGRKLAEFPEREERFKSFDRQKTRR